MRKILFAFLLGMCLLSVTGCSKKDCNGDLDGMWQLLAWQDKDNVLRANKDSMIFYSFQLQMAGFRRIYPKDIYLRSSMKYTPGMIQIYDPLIYVGGKHDEILPMSELAPLGVPEDGIFRILSMDGDAMILTTNQGDRLTFRKY